MPKLFSSTFFCALSIDDVIIECWITSPSSIPRRSITFAIRSDPKRRIKLSSKETKNWDEPTSPWRPARPRNWRSTRRDSWRSVPMIARPPAALDSTLNLISVPRPAIFVAIVTLPDWPASATISASRACCLAFRTLCWILRIVNKRLNNSEFSTEVVPTRTGRPLATNSWISSATALYFSRTVRYTLSS